MQRVYLETTVIGHIAGRLHPAAAVLTRQQLTRLWWETAADRYDLFVSDLILSKCGDGDPKAARERIEVVAGIDVLRTTVPVKELASALIAANAVPASEPRDALHIALAAIPGIDFSATWNFKHIMNPSTQHLIDDVCRDAGIETATICTPEQLLVTHDDS